MYIQYVCACMQHEHTNMWIGNIKIMYICMYVCMYSYVLHRFFTKSPVKESFRCKPFHWQRSRLVCSVIICQIYVTRETKICNLYSHALIQPTQHIVLVVKGSFTLLVNNVSMAVCYNQFSLHLVASIRFNI